MTTFQRTILATFYVLLVGASTKAQMQQVVEEQDMRLRTTAAEPTTRPGTLLPAPALQFELSQKDKRASLGATLRQGSLLLGATVATPVDGESTASFGDLTGLSNGTIADGSLSYMSWNPRVASAELITICRDYLTERDGAPPAIVGCSDDDFIAAGAVTVSEARRYRAEFRNAIDPGVVWLTSVHVSGGRSSFKYLDVPTATDTTIARTSRAFSASLAALMRTNTLVGLSYRKGTSYAASPTRQICSPILDSTSTLCRNTAIAAPTAKDENIVALDIRRFFSSRFAVSAKISRDIDRNLTGVEVPLYFMRATTGLTGGISVGWRSDEKEVAASVFIGSALKLFQ